MEIKEVINKEEWESFLSRCTEKTFLQSFNWGEFNIKMGSKIWRFGAYSQGKLICVALVIKVSARRGTFLFIPHGPVILVGISGKDKKEILELILLHLSDIAKEEKASFIRVSPIL
ncbi:MAG: peptidoglycan bridge formation glycyltransferase FemA/FemB family protein [Candidatus Staskawiczbacteria bacterium]|nr:peptidoglycan bridge formation glycyltransferase FemA/FemB family protein [Candidatus Staskawiczbacteria bacterium]